MVTWALDLDGVLWRGAVSIPGAAEAVARLRAHGARVVFLTNNAGPTIAEHLAKLEAMGVGADAGDLITSAEAAATLLEPGRRRSRPPAPGCARRSRRAACGSSRRGPPTPSSSGGTVSSTSRAWPERPTRSRAGARLIGTNEDATFPTPDGLLPGAGALLAAVAYASGATAEVAGKPHAPMRRLVAERVGSVAVMVGDRPVHRRGARPGPRRSVRPRPRAASPTSGIWTASHPHPTRLAPDLAWLVNGAWAGR